MSKQTKKQLEAKREKLNEFGLTELEEQFCHEYLVDLNQTQAYKRCKPDVKDSSAAAESWKLLRNPKVQRRIQELGKERQQRTDINADRVLLELARLAFYNFGDFAAWDDEGNLTLTPSNQLSKDQKAAIGTIKKITRTIPTRDGEPIIESRIELGVGKTGKEQNLNMLGRHLELFKDGPQNQMIINYNFPGTNKQKPTQGGK